MSSVATHALRAKWFVSFLPLLTSDMVATEFKGDWKLASEKKMQRLDWVTTVEEVWSTMNSLPKIQQLGFGTTFIFARDDKVPSFETFPNGSRLVVKLHKAPATDKGLETIIAVVLGETVTVEATDNVPVCDVIRVSARPSREHPDTVRVEVWLNDASYSSKVADFLRTTFRERTLASNQYAIEENPFETGSPATAKLVRTPMGASSSLQRSTDRNEASLDHSASLPREKEEAAQAPASEVAKEQGAGKESSVEEGTEAKEAEAAPQEQPPQQGEASTPEGDEAKEEEDAKE